MTSPSAHKCMIVGSGFSGICLAIKLKTGGITDFVILEKAQGVGADVEAQYNLDIQSRLQTMVWKRVSDSWCKSGGRITNKWPGSAGEYRRLTRKFCAQDFVVHSLVPAL